MQVYAVREKIGSFLPILRIIIGKKEEKWIFPYYKHVYEEYSLDEDTGIGEILKTMEEVVENYKEKCKKE